MVALKNLPNVSLREFHEALQGKSVPTLKMVDWVLNNLHREIGSIEPDEPPSYGCLVMLRWASENTDSFFRDFVAKLLPTKNQLEVDERQKDDGRMLVMLERMEQEFNATSAAGLAEEPPVSPADRRLGQLEQDGSR